MQNPVRRAASRGLILALFGLVVSLAGCVVASPQTLAVPDEPPRAPTNAPPPEEPALDQAVASEMDGFDEFAYDLGSCDAAAEGFGACAGSGYLVYCHQGRVLAIDCTLFIGVDGSDGRCAPSP